MHFFRKEDKVPRAPSADLGTFDRTFHDLAKKGDLKGLQKAVKSLKTGDPALSAKDEKGTSPLHLASEAGHLEIVNLLVEKGAKVNVIDKEGWSPLHIAAQERHFKICQVLLEQGCAPNIQNSEGTTSIHYLCRNKVSDDLRETIEILTKKGGNINAVNKYGESALHQAVVRVNMDVCKLLIEFRADVNLANKYGETPLHKAARVGNACLSIAKYLVECGANPLVSGSNGLPSEVVERKDREAEMYNFLVELEAKQRESGPATSRGGGTAYSKSGQIGKGGSSRNGGAQLRYPRRASYFDTMNISKFFELLESAESSVPTGGGNTKEEVESDPDCNVAWTEKFRLETGTRGVAYETPRGPATPPFPYRDDISTKKHFNLFGSYVAEPEQKLILSVLEDVDEKAGGYHALLLNSTGYQKILIPKVLVDTSTPQSAASGETSQSSSSAGSQSSAPSTPEKGSIPSSLSGGDVMSSKEKKKDKEKEKIPPLCEKFIDALADQYDLWYASDSHIQKDLLQLEVDDPAKTFCFDVGVMFARKGQTTEREFFDNETGSAEFHEFLDCIGEKITLEGWSGYRGGLDVQHNSKGTHSFHTEWKGVEVMYHVSTLMPYNAQDPDKLIRSGILRNDIGIILFQEYGSRYNPESMRSKLNHIVAVVTPLPKNSASEETKYRVSFVSRPDMASFDPPLPYPSVYGKAEIKALLVAKLINGILMAQRTAAFDVAFKEPRRHNIEEVLEKHPKGRKNRKSSLLNPLNLLIPRSKDDAGRKALTSSSPNSPDRHQNVYREGRNSNSLPANPLAELSSRPVPIPYSASSPLARSSPSISELQSGALSLPPPASARDKHKKDK